MNLLISRNLQGASGPGIFTRRLMDALVSRHGVKIVSGRSPSYGNPDIVLSGIQYRDKSYRNGNAKRVFRVDGCYYDRSVNNRDGKNKGITKGILKSDGVIYQSQFSKDLAASMLGVGGRENKSTIIYNGFDQSVVESTKKIDKDCEWLFMASAKWRHTKRPNSIINGFLEADVPDSKLIMFGMERGPIHKRIQYVPFINSKKLYGYYKSSDALIHMCYLDSCSNSVVEALSFGTPVICNNTGGTPEIVKNSGYIVKCDKFDFQTVKKVGDHIPPAWIAQSVHDCVKDNHRRVSRPEFDLKLKAQQYYDFFLDVLRK